MGLLARLESIAALRRTMVEEAGFDPFGAVVEQILSPTRAVIGGQEVILAGSNNYLGLTFHRQCIDAACSSLHREGTGTTGSRMANGTYAGHRELERELAAFFGWQEAIVFSTGFLANLGMISALAGPGNVILLDADAHASIYDGARLSGAEILRFRHNDLADLDKRLQRLGGRATEALILVEGIYSMLGDRAPLAGIAALKRRYGAWLLVDEAHSLGVLGEKGRGLAEAEGVAEDVDFIVGTFSKSLGNIGGFCVSHHPQLEFVRYMSRPYIFTASPSPATVAAVRTALKVLMQEHSELRARLWENAQRLHRGLKKLGFDLQPEASPIIPVFLPGPQETLRAWKSLLDQGVYVNLILPPAAPEGRSMLRCSISAAHSPGEIAAILQAFANLMTGGAAAQALS